MIEMSEKKAKPMTDEQIKEMEESGEFSKEHIEFIKKHRGTK